MRCELAVYHLSSFSLVGQERLDSRSNAQLLQPGISRSKLCGIPDAKEIPVVRVLSESLLSGSHVTEAASARTNIDRQVRSQTKTDV